MFNYFTTSRISKTYFSFFFVDGRRKTGVGTRNTLVVNATHGTQCSHVRVRVPICMSKL